MAHRYRVSQAYESAYSEPLAVAKGSTLTAHRRDAEWPGWIWCTRDGSAGGWVPESWVQFVGERSCVLLRDYTAREVSVDRGELVTASITESGWAWVTNAAGHSGWVPLRHLVPE